ncbi:putative ubiquinone/menaquinone biosynthesis methylase [Magnetofaba australis IT-1]|uniref:Putative ubiquinone/menaquinone biosynthesis methylase n=2 Tax=Magnetofaba TaxID=1472292 RepID=A0A1Y2K1B1_9PROT|nr:putative ubiquinone/menaquinone biosynthesis methylase [Magnetofaba australis IT-1]
MKAFYEKTPFPNYDGFDDAAALVQKAKQGFFARLLDEQTPFGAKIVECGCGTGQLSNFLGVGNNRVVVGLDLCLNSLRLANGFKQRNKLNNTRFFQANLFRPPLCEGSFDYVISNGVLHHTSDPKLAFHTIAKLAKPGGYVLVGLYHQYGRLWTDLRRWIFRVGGDKFKFLDPRTLSQRISAEKREAWFQDQYKNPHESKHTIGEVIDWLDEAGLEFVKSVPKAMPFESFSANEKLFDADARPEGAARTLAEMLMTFNNAREGGFFIVIARKPANG